jgi:hypothetical protein
MEASGNSFSAIGRDDAKRVRRRPDGRGATSGWALVAIGFGHSERALDSKINLPRMTP